MSTRQINYLSAGVLAAMGLVFVGQGLGYIPGSFMTGAIQWFWIGLALLLGGSVQAVLAFLYGPKKA
jgi:hypothetical protein